MTRGRLRIYLGAAPGVGKTVAMLAEGRRRLDRGTDVVIAVCETHGRTYTEQALAGIPVIAQREVRHGGSVLREMDLDAVIERAPRVALVDELAHTNVPGCRHTKRWQDVETLLDHGIDVISTVNVQHLESLNDVVESITGIHQQETVPDRVVRSADQIELVDMSPQALRRRLAHGNVYRADRVDAALANYFREGNLTALRELSLLWLANRVDEGLAEYRTDHRIDAPWPTRERVVVALTGGPEGATLLRRGAQIASRGPGGELIAVHITSSDGLKDAGAADLAALRSLTAELGGSFQTVSGDDVAAAILNVARGVNARQIVLGASRHRVWQRLLRNSVNEEVVAGSGDIDVLLVSHERAALNSRRFAHRNNRAALPRHPRRTVAAWLVATIGIAAMTVLLNITRDLHDVPLEMLAFLCLTVAAALLGGFLPAIVAALLGSLSLNWYFTPPIHTLNISSGQNAVAVGVFVVVAISVGSVVHLSESRARAAQIAQREAQALADAAQHLLGEVDPLPALLQHTVDVFGMHSAAIVRERGQGATPEIVCATPGFEFDDGSAASVNAPVTGDTGLVLLGPVISGTDRRIVSAFAAHAAALLRRSELAAQADTARELAAGNRGRTALLAAVSHDLRTPLAGIKAAVSTLREPDLPLTPSDSADLLETIEESTDRLTALVTNLLDQSRLQSQSVQIHPREVSMREVIDAAVRSLPAAEQVQVEVPSILPAVRTDAGLLERVIANLLENARRYAGPTPVRIQAAALPGRIQVRVIDRGPGVPDDQKDAIFAPFQRMGDVPVGDGVGLGLAVSRGLVEALGGTLSAEDTPGGGLTMVVDLPETANGMHVPTLTPTRSGGLT